MSDYRSEERKHDRLPDAEDRPDMDDMPHTFWTCPECYAENSCFDGECQFCAGPEVAVPCIDGTENHVFVTSDENSELCYCELCGTVEY